MRARYDAGSPAGARARDAHGPRVGPGREVRIQCPRRAETATSLGRGLPKCGSGRRERPGSAGCSCGRARPSWRPRLSSQSCSRPPAAARHKPQPSNAQLKLGPLSALGTLKPPPSQGSNGFEGVPIPAAPPLTGLAAAATGSPINGIRCQTSEQLIFHIHAHLTIFINGTQRQIAAGIGIPGSQTQQTSQGPVAAGRVVPVLAAHPCPRRHRPRRVANPPYLHPGRLLR